MPQFSVPFVLNYFKYVLIEEFLEILSRYTDVDIVVYLNGNADSVAFTYAKAAGKNDIVVYLMLCNCLLKKLNDLLGALKMAGRAYANLNE